MEKRLLSLALFLCTTLLFAQTWTNYTSSDGLIEGFIDTMIIDNQGQLWYVSWSDSNNPGIGSFDGTTFNQFGLNDGTTSNDYRGLAQDLQGNYWFGTFLSGENGVDYFDGTTWINYNTTDGLAGGDVVDIMVGNDGNIWMTCTGSTSGLTTYEGTNFTSYVADGSQLPEVGVFKLDQDSNDTFWIATTGGLLEFDLTNYTLYTSNDGLINDQLSSVLVDSNDVVWAGSFPPSGGLNRYDGTSFTTFTIDDGLPNDHVRAIFEDSLGNLWVGTDIGVSKYDGTSFTNYDESDGLVENHVRSIVEDNEGNLWFGTWGGISKFNPTLGIFESSKAKIALYPNPAQEWLNIETTIELNKVAIYNLLGHEVLQISKNFEKLNISQLSSGMYWVVLTDINNQQAIKKIVIK